MKSVCLFVTYIKISLRKIEEEAMNILIQKSRFPGRNSKQVGPPVNALVQFQCHSVMRICNSSRLETDKSSKAKIFTLK